MQAAESTRRKQRSGHERALKVPARQRSNITGNSRARPNGHGRQSLAAGALQNTVSSHLLSEEDGPEWLRHFTSPMPKAEAMNRFLKSLDMSFRRDERSLRPRVNKLESRLDKDQKISGNFYYKH